VAWQNIKPAALAVDKTGAMSAPALLTSRNTSYGGDTPLARKLAIAPLLARNPDVEIGSSSTG
jgi:hypothetical protein